MSVQEAAWGRAYHSSRVHAVTAIRRWRVIKNRIQTVVDEAGPDGGYYPHTPQLLRSLVFFSERFTPDVQYAIKRNINANTLAPHKNGVPFAGDGWGIRLEGPVAIAVVVGREVFRAACVEFIMI